MIPGIKPLHEQVIVISAGDSPLGEEVTNLAVAVGARVVVAAPTEELLQKLTDSTSKAGMAVYVQADASNEAQVNRISKTAIRTFGGFDTWINIAGAPLTGSSLDLPASDLKLLGESSFWGIVLGSRTAAAHYIASGQAGTIINVHNIFPDGKGVNLPLYFASRQAVKGWTDGFRIELGKSGDHISVSLIQPGRQRMKNTVDNSAYPKQHEIAKAILHCATHQKKEIYIGSQSRLSDFVNGFAPLLTRMIDGSPEGPVSKPAANRGAPSEDANRIPDPALRDESRKTKYPFLSTIVFAGIGAGLWLFSRKKKES